MLVSPVRFWPSAPARAPWVQAATGSSSAVEHFLAKEDVEGSNPFSRSTNPIPMRCSPDSISRKSGLSVAVGHFLFTWNCFVRELGSVTTQSRQSVESNVSSSGAPSWFVDGFRSTLPSGLMRRVECSPASAAADFKYCSFRPSPPEFPPITRARARPWLVQARG